MTRLNSRDFDVKNNKIIYKTENPLITHVLGTLNNIRIKGWRNNTVGIYDEKKKKWRKPHNQLRGVSDIIGILPACKDMQAGRWLAVECKSENDKASKEQIDFINMINEEGGVGLFAKNIEHVLERLEKEGYIKINSCGITRNY